MRIETIEWKIKERVEKNTVWSITICLHRWRYYRNCTKLIKIKRLEVRIKLWTRKPGIWKKTCGHEVEKYYVKHFSKVLKTEFYNIPICKEGSGMQKIYLEKHVYMRKCTSRVLGSKKIRILNRANCF